MKAHIGVYAALAVLLSGAAAQAEGLSPAESDPRAIMQAVFNRSTGNSSVSQTEMTISLEADSPRVRKMRRWSRKFEGGTKALVIIEEPADLKNTAFLNLDYDDGARDDDQWLYLPALHRAKRIGSSGRSGSFMGSDFSYADLSRTDPADYDFKLIEPSTSVDGEDCWLIEATPRTDKAKEETGYLKKHVWVSKAKTMEVQIKAWVIRGKSLKYIKLSDIRQVQGIWTAHQIEGRTVSRDKLVSRTVVRTLGIKYDDPSVKDDLFTERRLEQGL
jgi:outer membrane lipoprotein-sorting protein